MPTKILLTGKKGLGKSTMAYHIINYILSNNEDFKYDSNRLTINKENRSFKLLQNNSHPNFYLIDLLNDKKNIDVAQIREMITYTNKSAFNNNFYEKVQKGFIKILKKKPKQYMKIDSNLNIKNNEKIVLNKVNDLI